MKKFFYVLIVLIFVFAPVFGVNVSDMLERAKENGNSFRSVENSYKSSMNTLNARNAASSVSISVSTSQKISELFAKVPDVSFKATLPEFEEDLSINVGLDSKTGKDGYSISPSVDVRKEFVFSENEIKNPADDANRLQVELSYRKGILQAENNFYDSIISIMQSESQLKSSEKTLERTKEDYKTSISIGQIQEGSVNDLKTKMQIESAQSSLDSSKVQLQSLKNNFFSNYGIEFEDVSEVDECDLTFDSSLDSNTELYISYLKLLDALQSYQKSTGDYSSMTVSGSLGGPLSFSEGKFNSYGLSISGGADYTSGNLKLGISMGTQMVDNKLTEPTVTVSGSWSASASSSANDDNTRIQYLSAQASYDSQLLTSRNSVLSLQNDISSYMSEVEQFKIKKQYNLQIFESQSKLYELDYISLRDYQDAADNVALDEINEIILAIKGLKLENQIKILCL